MDGKQGRSQPSNSGQSNEQNLSLAIDLRMVGESLGFGQPHLEKLDWKTRSTRENGKDKRFSATDDGSWTDDIIGKNAVVRDEYVKGWSDLYWTVVKRPQSSTQRGEVMDDDGEGTGEFHDYTVHYKTPIPQLTHDYETDLD